MSFPRAPHDFGQILDATHWLAQTLTKAPLLAEDRHHDHVPRRRSLASLQGRGGGRLQDPGEAGGDSVEGAAVHSEQEGAGVGGAGNLGDVVPPSGSQEI